MQFKKITKYLPWLILAIGILLRTVIFFQNRNLGIDEANVARNLAERGFEGLFQPLSYEQYAPPLFLWICKFNMNIFGAYEWALRLFPFLSSLASLVLFWFLLKKMNVKSALFFPFALLATGMIYIRYASELKQYSSDMMVCMSLLLLALHFNILKHKPLKVFLVWSIVGSLAMWLSMPAVFILFGIGIYYCYTTFKDKCTKQLLPFIASSIFLILEFAFYYWVILKPSIQTDYLQNCHKQHLLFLYPFSSENLQHDIDAFGYIVSSLGGYWVLSVAFNLSLGIWGCIRLMRNNRAEYLLFISPLIALLVAVLAHRFTLMPRVCLFAYPILLLFIGVGFDNLLTSRLHRYAKICLVLIACYVLALFQELKWLNHELEYEKPLEGFEWIKQHSSPKQDIYIHEFVQPAMLYYTSIHPDSAKWGFMKKAQRIDWATDIELVCKKIQTESIFMYAFIDDYELNKAKSAFNAHFLTQDSLVRENQHIYLFSPLK